MTTVDVGAITEQAPQVHRGRTCSRMMVLALGLALLAGCQQPSATRLPVGPLGSRPENYGTVGQPVLRTGADTIGDEAVFNGGTKPAIIDRLVIVSPRHMTLRGAYVTLGYGVVGNWPSFPPAIHGDRFAAKLWAHRHRPSGAVIPPHTWAGIALGLSATAAHGSIASTDLYYHVGSRHYEWRGHVRIVLTRVRKF